MKKKTKRLNEHVTWMKTMIGMITLIVPCLSAVNILNQNVLQKLEFKKSENEKQPFFAVIQDYDPEENQYLYYISNTGGQVRDVEPYFQPYIMVKINSSITGERLDTAFISLPKDYQSVEIADDSIMLSFKDLWIDTALMDEPRIYRDGSTRMLLNDYLNLSACEKQSSLKDKQVTANIVYRMAAHYVDYENIEQFKQFWYDRSADMSGKTFGNNSLFVEQDLQKLYKKAADTGNVYYLDGDGCSPENMAQQCDQIIAEFCGKIEAADPKYSYRGYPKVCVNL